MLRSRLLWGLAITTYGIGDTLTTYINLWNGLREINPLINQYSIIPVKILILVFLFVLSKRISDDGVIPLLLIIMGLMSSYHNISIWI